MLSYNKAIRCPKENKVIFACVIRKVLGLDYEPTSGKVLLFFLL